MCEKSIPPKSTVFLDGTDQKRIYRLPRTPQRDLITPMIHCREVSSHESQPSNISKAFFTVKEPPCDLIFVRIKLNKNEALRFAALFSLINNSTRLNLLYALISFANTPQFTTK